MEFESDDSLLDSNDNFRNSNDYYFDNSTYSLPLIRQPTHLLIIYCVAYGIIFIIGLAGNAFVVIAVTWNISMRNITNYLITNLAIADLLIIILTLPSTLATNIFYGKSNTEPFFRKGPNKHSLETQMARNSILLMQYSPISY